VCRLDHAGSIGKFLTGSPYRAYLVKAVNSGYLNYKDCDLYGERLETAELWAVSQAMAKDSTDVANARLLVSSSVLSAPGRPQEAVESVISLLESITNTILGVKSTSAVTDSEAERYKQVFGDLSPEDIARLDQHLEDKIALTQQEAESKAMALAQLEQELSRKFKERVRGR